MSQLQMSRTDPPRTRERRTESHSRGFSVGFVVKLVAMALINAFGLYGILAAWAVGHVGILIFLVVTLVAVNLIYFLPTRRLLPAKYLAPGVIFLLVFQVFVVAYTAGIAFTNYGDGHNAGKDDAVAALIQQNEAQIEGTPTYPVTVVEQDGVLGFATIEDGQALVALDGEPLAPATDAEVAAGSVVAVPGYETLTFSDVVVAQHDVLDIRIPVADNPEEGSLRTSDGRVAFIYEQLLVYDADADTFTAPDGTVFSPDPDTGNFTSADGEVLTPGWQVNVGFDNFRAIFDAGVLGGPFITVTLWTFAFAVLSVATTFFLGLLIAILFNDATMKGRKIYRAFVILPYAFPGFLGILIWAGLLNTDFGFVNEILLGGASLNWLGDPWLARLSAVLVNLWLGFPYMFLISTGALQSIPGDVYEAARIDGAGATKTFRSITLPLLLVAVGPLLIASFAMNFNNFNLIYLLTGGGPRDLSSATGVGYTDILITFVYKIAFEGGQNQYGLASAISILIFIMVGVISAIAFRRSKALQEIS